MTWPITGAAVRSWQESDEEPTPALESAVAAVVDYVPQIPGLAKFWTPSAEDPLVREFAPPAEVELGAVMLAARLYARRGAPLGDAGGYQEFGVVQILRQDPDIMRLLRVGTGSGGLVFGAPTPVVVTP